MAYTKTSWLTGDVITAAKINNAETQYDQVKATYLDKFSTASTGTTLLSCASTYTIATLTLSPHMYIPIPPGIQRSRFELSVTGNFSTAVSGSGSLVLVYLFRGLKETTGVTYTAAQIGSSWSTAAAGMVRTVGFTAQGGEWFTLSVYNGSSTNFNFWNVKLAGTSTSLTDNSSLIIPWTTNTANIPSSTG